LSLSERNGTLLWRCHAGCPQARVLEALRERGLVGEAAPSRRQSPRPRRTIVATYDYTDAAGNLAFQVVRFDPKDFRQRRPDGRGGWLWNLDGVQPVLYRLPDVLAAVRQGERIYIAEGERDVESLRVAGVVATCNPGGAGKWRPAYAHALRGAQVVVIRDKDEAGHRHAEQVIASLRDTAAHITLVEAREGKDATDHLAGGWGLDDFVEVPLPDPAHPSQAQEPPDGASLLAEVEAWLRRYLILPNEHAYVAVTLWAAHAHALACFESTPRLAFLSPEPECGKTRALELLELLVPHPMLAVNATPAALFRAVGDQEHRPTLLFDEIDALFGPKAKEHEELRSLLNAGHRRSGTAYRCVGEGTKQQVQAFPAFAAVALGGIGDLPDTLRSRSIVIPMRRRAPGEVVVPFRQREAAPVGARLRDGLARWMAASHERLLAIPVMPEGVTDRAADGWEPLLAIADAAGGSWPERARVAAVALVAHTREQAPSLGIRLLEDLRTIFEREGKEALPTSVLLERLHRLEESPWSSLRGKPLDAYGLARRLGAFEIRSKNIRDGGDGRRVVKGYDRSSFVEAWERYLPRAPRPAAPAAPEPSPAVPSPSAHAAPAAPSRGAAGAEAVVVADAIRYTNGAPLHDPPTVSRLGRAACAAVADVADVAAFSGRGGERAEPAGDPRPEGCAGDAPDPNDGTHGRSPADPDPALTDVIAAYRARAANAEDPLDREVAQRQRATLERLVAQRQRAELERAWRAREARTGGQPAPAPAPTQAALPIEGVGAQPAQPAQLAEPAPDDVPYESLPSVCACGAPVFMFSLTGEPLCERHAVPCCAR
jgi:5S rRNA maturation endonuclease (ribonuclease M5)